MAPSPSDETTSMQGAAGGPAAMADVASSKPSKKAKKTVEMAKAAPASGAMSPADQALAELGTKRGIETLFRTNYRVNMDLTSLADTKANIMISINGLIISLLIGQLAPGIEKNTWLLWPASLFLIGCLISLIYAVLAARPRVQGNLVTRESALKNRTNVLFFGNFHHMSQEDYVYVMKEVVQDPTQIYEMMIKDIHGVGSVLQKKYELIRRSYTVFLVALVVGVIGFIGAFTYAANQESGPAANLDAETQQTSPAVTPGSIPIP